MCIGRIELEPTHESVLQTIREAKYKLLVDRLDSVVDKALERD
jgi:hypothetical protein